MKPVRFPEGYGTSTRRWRGGSAAIVLFSLLFIGQQPTVRGDVAPGQADVVVYGGTSGGVVAAIQARRMGLSAVVVEPGQHVGGLSSGGLGATDIGNKAAIGGLAREFYRRVGRQYADDSTWLRESREQYQRRRKSVDEEEMWTFEPHVAERVFRQWLDEAGVVVAFGERLDLTHGGVTKNDGRITSIRMESGRTFTGRMFIDASYEGDLMARAGVSYHVGREGQDVYDESLNGVRVSHAVSHQFTHDVDPYVVPGDATSGLVPLVQAEPPGTDGAGDHRVQAYNFRMCTTDVPENRLDWPQPEGYDAKRYELLLRTLEAGDRRVPWTPVWMPNRKTDTNNNFAISTDYIGANYDYPEADHATRERIIEEHRRYQQGLMYTLANHPRVPEEVRGHFRRLGPAKDEFTDNGNWPHQLYVREARRMVCDYVMTQHDCQQRRVPEDPVGLGAYNMDSHNCQRYVTIDGVVRNEGDIQVGVSPYRISWRSIRPRRTECGNLLVPVCLAASHIAYGSIRMEPVFMVLGQSAATAAAIAIRDGCDVQAIDYSELHARLLADGQALEWTGPVRTDPSSVDPATLAGVVVDDASAERRGAWMASRSIGGFVGDGYLHDDAAGKGEKSVSFRPDIPSAGLHEVRLYYTPSSNRAARVPVTISLPEGERRIIVDQRKPSSDGFLVLGQFILSAGLSTSVTVANDDTEGHVVVDAVQFIPVKELRSLVEGVHDNVGGKEDSNDVNDDIGASNDSEDEGARRREVRRFEGAWQAVSVTNDGNDASPKDLQGLLLTFDAEGAWILSEDGQEQLRGTVDVRPGSDPKGIDFDFKGGDGTDNQLQGIYGFSDDRERPAGTGTNHAEVESGSEPDTPKGWRLCLRPGSWRPLRFEAHAGTGGILFEFERA
ncbi:MAG: FAD-dependent oxidoreductase, partial [Planctomycetaceae bacterium]